MSVYVGALFDSMPFGQSRGWRKRYGHACHMWADTEKELHEMARTIGLRRAWFQPHRTLPHYDLTAKRRVAAIMAGAVQASEKEYIRRLRSAPTSGEPEKRP